MDEKRIEKEFLAARPPLAYAKLQGMIDEDRPFEAFITQLPVKFGRGAQAGHAISLGDLMSVSRQHASINWNAERSCFELTCLGKNGMHAGGKRIEQKEVVVLTPKMPLRIGGARIYFLPAVKPSTSIMSGLKLIQKAFEKANPSKTVGLSVEEAVDAIYNCFKDIDYEVGGRQNLTTLVKSYFECPNSTFKRVSVSPAGELRYIHVRPEGADEPKKRQGTASAESKKKQKVATQESPATTGLATPAEPAP
ncbi:hypothetical protein SPRG_06688 [Saprolegnia parasitica CBS 223.65]|uniref:FHA domain-containing protein n=1 Tax=Saprolegnia parasitica (strain CBS 223.65) TaxID=695850 RepID=A0A067CGY3_SAPPC|nr:hypothetical protein SPRG_06688 [Saprolegnia parasitica CBS 223.65]KDO28450.1 hypothetical protein SPRG_06688 [Saprolegnia parasitica CBS 223.65]|eukprot:XP_012200890.1 hypothetical protein SPRG_06688 [Saprolegnia parasitica CBS 223.65]